MRDKGGWDQRVEVMRNNNILDTFLKVDPHYLIKDWIWGVEQR